MRGKRFTLTFVALILLFTTMSTASANYWGGTRNTAISYVLDSSMDFTHANYFTSAANSWNNISSAVTLTKASSSPPANADKYFATTTSLAGILGEMIPLKVNCGACNPVIAGKEENWYYAQVIIYTNTMNDSNMTAGERTTNARHEIGHSLKLIHPPGHDVTTATVMRQGIQNLSPTTYDKTNLKSKWGN